MSIVLALPKGRILDECAPLLGAAGIIPAPDYANESSRRLRFPTNHPGLDIVRVRSFDVATFVAFGAAEIGICGGDVLMEFDYPEVYAPLDLNIGHCRISVAEPKDEAGLTKLYELSSIRVASKYPSVTRRHFASRGVVQTGSTLKANGLVETDIIAKVSSRLIVNRIAFKTRPDEIGAWIERFRTALTQKCAA
jgi:ATP phosphoribosyltransferase